MIKHKPASSTPSPTVSRGNQYGPILKNILGGIAFIAVTVFFGWTIIGKPIQAWQQTRHWVETPAYILNAELVTHNDTQNNTLTYETTARYRYSFSGEQYEGTRVSLYSGSDNASSFHHSLYNTLTEYVGSEKPFRCFVNPDQPGQAVLFRDIRWGITFFVGLIVMLFSLAGVAIIVTSVKQKSGSPTHKRQPATERHSVDVDQAYLDAFKAVFETSAKNGLISDLQQATPLARKQAAVALVRLILPAIRQRKVAVLLALLLGWMGVHKFYLGKPVQGVLYLFFLWTTVPLILSVIDCIRLLVMSDDAFDLKYGVPK